MVDKDRLVRSLRRFAHFYCAYTSVGGQEKGSADPVRGRCDCKYMIDDADEPRFRSECHPGCPEFWQAAAIIEKMTKAEYEKASRRAGGKPARRKRRAKA